MKKKVRRNMQNKEELKNLILKNGGKICIKCDEFKTIDNFIHRPNHYVDDYSNICRDCENKRRNDYYENNKDVLFPIHKKRKIKYAKNNKDKINEWQRRYYHENFKITHKMNFIWRSVLSSCLRRMNRKKDNRTIVMLGYSSEDLRIHIEGQFTSGMSWCNYGDWHIDHIKSVSSFSNDTPASIVNALSNLRPMWSTTRIIDGCLYEGNLNKSKFDKLNSQKNL